MSEIPETDQKIGILAKSLTLAQMIPNINKNIDVWMEFDIVLRLWDFLP